MLELVKFKKQNIVFANMLNNFTFNIIPSVCNTILFPSLFFKHDFALFFPHIPNKTRQQKFFKPPNNNNYILRGFLYFC